MLGIKKKAWGKVKGGGVASAAAPTVHLDGGGKRPPVLIEDIDVSKIEFGPVEDGEKDRYCRIKYDGGRFEFSFADLPKFARMSFKAGPFEGNKDTPRREGDEKWSTRVELTPDQYNKWVAIEEKFNSDMEAHRVAAYPHDVKKKELPCSKEVFRSKFRTSVVAADTEKGYAASMKVAVEHEQGKQPRIQRLHVLDGPNGELECTRPKPGTIHQLVAKCAISGGGTIKRGGYFGNFGHGLKVTLTWADIVVNKQESAGPAPNYGGVKWSDAPTPDDDDEYPGQQGGEGSEAGGEEGEQGTYTQEQMDAAVSGQ